MCQPHGGSSHQSKLTARLFTMLAGGRLRFVLTNPAISFRSGHPIKTLVDKPWFTKIVDTIVNVFGLGAISVGGDVNSNWYYYADAGPEKRLKACFQGPEKVLVGRPEFQVMRNPNRLTYVLKLLRTNHLCLGLLYDRRPPC